MSIQFDTRFLSYAAYHRNSVNKFTHFFGVPLATYGLLLLLCMFRFAFADLLPGGEYLSLGLVFYVSVAIWFVRMAPLVGGVASLVNLPIYLLAEWTIAKGPQFAILIFFAANILGWAIQIVGHIFEGRRPALTDNIFQIFNAPVFLVAEVFFLFGWRPDLRRQAVGD